MLFGAMSLIPEPCGSAYEALMRREHERRVMMLDPNIRPGFIQDKEKHLARMGRMIGMADIVKLSDDDLAWFGETGSHADIAAKWLELGPKLVIITGGSKGATGYTKEHKISVASRAGDGGRHGRRRRHFQRRRARLAARAGAACRKRRSTACRKPRSTRR